MKFICAGLSKTGTKSISRALRILGFKVYDFDDQLFHYMSEWHDLFSGKQVPDFYRMFKDVDVVVDFPSNCLYEELMEVFPEAKVILSVRGGGEDAWVKSLKNQFEVIDDSYLTKVSNRWIVPWYNKSMFVLRRWQMALYGATDPNATFIYRKRYRLHNERVKAVVPADKLLVFTVEQGWKPLCEFTGKEIPDDTFPHLNVKGAISQTFLTETEHGRKIMGEVRVALLWLAVFVAVLVAVFIAVLMY